MKKHRVRALVNRHRRIVASIGIVLVGLLIWVGVSLGSALGDPSLGGSLSARLAEWARSHGGASLVTWIEAEWYRHHPPKVGGMPGKGTIKAPLTSSTPVPSGPVHLSAPLSIEPFASPAIPGEGAWSPVGRLIDGIPALYTTTLRPDAIHTSYVAGVAWMDTKLLKATLYSGNQIPGGGPYAYSAPIKPTAATSLVAAFNAGFRMSTANGGYYTQGRYIYPLRTGAASFVIYKDGSCAIGAWGNGGLVMTPTVVSVRQNLDLLVNDSVPVAGLNSTTTTKWGYTLGNAVYISRSGVGITADGALVYVGGPNLNITDLANILARAGAVRAMELDINTTWVNFSYYTPSTDVGPATPTNGHLLLSQMHGGVDRYFATWWARDFFTMSSRSAG